jgi:acetylornithine/succinyldiaminopimelate/putrescine aminotransferase
MFTFWQSVSVYTVQCTAALFQVLVDEKLAERAEEMGEKLREQLRQLPSSVVKTVRGKGLLNALVIDSKYDAWEVSQESLKFSLFV